MNAFSIIRSGTLVIALGALAPTGTAAAQASPYLDFNNPSVTIDLSVIDDSGYGAAPGDTASTGSTLPRPYKRGRLLLPGAHAPSSMLHVKPVGGTRAMRPKPTVTTKIKAKPQIKKLRSVAKAAPAPAAAPAKPIITKALPATKPAVVAAAPKILKAPEAPQALSPPPPPIVAKTQQVTSAKSASEPKAKAAPSKTKKTKQASIPAAGAGIDHGLAMQVIFANDATRLPSDAKGQLTALAGKVKTQDNIRVQLLAYAGGDKLSASLARRLSLSRALSVRSFLIENGIRSTRIDVRALGNKTSTKPRNRVDLNITER